MWLRLCSSYSWKEWRKEPNVYIYRQAKNLFTFVCAKHLFRFVSSFFPLLCGSNIQIYNSAISCLFAFAFLRTHHTNLHTGA